MTIECPKCQHENPEETVFCGKCGTQFDAKIAHTKTLETSTEELKRGTVFAGRYEIIEELGKGGMGNVYRVEDTKVKEEIAFKLIKPEIAADKKTIERFRNELKIARKIRHKNVCAMFDLSEEKESHFITMEYVSGGDLKKFIRRSGQMGVGKAISIAKQICDGLEEAHNLGIVHRDLKPNNIMIDDNGNARIMDFGIARTVKGKGITGAGVMIGTPEYMSPEQVEAKEVDQRSDIYSLGIILYEMLTGRLPFEAETPFAVGVKHKSEIPKNPKEFNPQIPDDLSDVILKCLEKEKENRYQSASDVQSELKKIELGLPTTDWIIPKKKPLTSKEMTVTFNLKRLLLPASIAAALVIVILFVWSLWSNKESSPNSYQKPSIAILPFEDISPLKDQDSFCDGLSTSIIIALSNLSDVTVQARSSSFAFKDKGLSPQEIGNRLSVNTILEGTLQKEGNRLQLTAQLIDVSDASLIWGHSWIKEMDDTFDVQDEITNAVVKNLKIKLLGEEEAKLKKRPTENVRALNLYSTGLYFWNRRTGDSLEKAIDYFNQAIEEDPDYALAYVGLADCHNLLHMYSGTAADITYPKAKKYALKALEIDENLGEAHNSLAYYLERYEWDLEGAEKEFKLALELNPNHATAHHWYSEILDIAGKYEEALEEARIALELDPISLIINSELGWVYLHAGKHEQAVAQLRKTIDMEPNFAQAHLMLGILHLDMKNLSEATSEFLKAKELSGGNDISLAYLGYSYGRSSETDKASTILQELLAKSKKQYVAPYWIAQVYAGLGRNEDSLDYLDKAYEERNEFLVFLNSERMSFQFASLRSLPRYQELLKKIKSRKELSKEPEQ